MREEKVITMLANLQKFVAENELTAATLVCAFAFGMGALGFNQVHNFAKKVKRRR